MTNVFEQEGSHNEISYNSEDTIASRFEGQVAAVPDKPAIVTDEILLTYRELDLKASRIAAMLASLPCQARLPIVLFMKDETACVAAMLGALKANRIFVPLAPNSPEKWLAQVIEDSGATHIIVDSTTRSIAELAAAGSATVVGVDDIPLSLRATDSNVSSGDTAYIVYTSGSTGRPKGVANSHRSLIRRCEVRYPLFGLGRKDRYANLRSSGVSAGINNTLMSLLCGGTLFPFDLHRRGLQELAPWLIAKQITFVSISAPLLRTWLASLPDELRFPVLGFVGATGERLYAEDIFNLSRHLEGDWRIGYSYSSTEAGSIAAQVFTPSRLPDSKVVAVPVGRPVDGVEVSIKDETNAPVPLGEIGEIVVRSRFLAQGYWNNPELTAKAFQADPLDHTIRIYRTGDLGRRRSDGTIELAGRKDRRIRLHGYNVEPLQVESELMRQPGVSEAVVILHDDPIGQEPCLVGYVVAPSNASPSGMREALKERLPPYMVPSYIVVLDTFPVTRSAKIDRNALPPPDRGEARQATLRAPSDDCEHELLAIWQEVLKLPKIGVDDDFFQLGGTSLQALMVFARIEARLGCSLSPTTIVQAPTVACLAEFIRSSTGNVTSQSLVPLRAFGKHSPLFLVHNRYCFVMYYRHLVSALNSDRPVFGLQPLPLDGKHRIARTIESMATDYITEIRRVQPNGPYLIAGHSFGGRVSFEIAQQLGREGERVSFLGFIDTGLLDTPADEKLPISSALRFGHHVHEFFRKMRWIREAVLVRWYTLGLRLGFSIPYEDRPAYYDRLCRKANRKYVCQPYMGGITMFSSAGNSEQQRAHWGSLVRGELTVLEIPAGHDDMVLPPYSKLLAKYFDACLDVTVRGEDLVSYSQEVRDDVR